VPASTGRSSQEEALIGTKGEKLWGYWLKNLAEPLPVLSLPTDRPRPSKLSYKGNAITVPVPSNLHTQLTALSRAEGVTLYTLLLAAWYTLLYRYTGQEDIIVGSPMACRADPNRQNCAGYFVNPLPLRSNVGGDPSFRAHLSRVKQVVMGALVHQELPLPLLVQRTQEGKERDPSRMPLFQVRILLICLSVP
jgi:hypothetical protein